VPLNADDGRRNRRNALTRYATDWNAYARMRVYLNDLLHPVVGIARIPAHLLRALCARVDAPKLRRAA
jgi:hypothetical protein